MPKGSAALTKARREEIVQACARLYETRSFREITLKEIGAQTTFTRTSIYNYFQTKEEIFLALLQREHEAWAEDLEELARRDAALSAEAFADALAGKRVIPFATSGGSSIDGATRSLQSHCPQAKWVQGQVLHGNPAAWAKRVLAG